MKLGPSGVVGAVCVMISVAAPPFLVAVLAVPIGRTLGLSTAQLGAGIAGYFLVSAVMSPVIGRNVVRWGAPGVLRVSCALVTVCLCLIAVAPDAVTIVVLLAVVGVPNAAAQPAATHVITGITTMRTRALSFGLVQASVPATTLLAGLALAASQAVPWRTTVLSFAGLTLLAQLVIRAAPTAAVIVTPPEQQGAAEGSEHGVPAARGRRFVVWMAAAGFLLSFPAMCLPSFLVLTGVGAGMHPTAVATVQIGASLTSIVARITVATHGGRSHGAAGLTAAVALAAAGAVGFVLLSVGEVWAFVAGALIAYGAGWGWSGLFNLNISRGRPDRAAASAGITQAGIFLGGSMGPLVFASVVTLADTDLAWTGAAISSVLAGCCLAAARRQWTTGDGTPDRTDCGEAVRSG